MSEGNHNTEEISREEFEEARERLEEVANDNEDLKGETIKLLEEKVDLLNDMMATMVTVEAIELVLEESGLDDDDVNEIVTTIKHVDQEVRWDSDE